MLGAVMDQMAALAQGPQVAAAIVPWVVVEMRGGEDDAGVSEAYGVLDIRPTRRPAPPISPCPLTRIEPSPVRQYTQCRAVRPTAPLANAVGAAEANRIAD